MKPAVVLWCLLFGTHVARAATVTEVHYVMGTYFRIIAEHGDEPAARAALRRCFGATRDLEERFSRFDPNSELSRLNATVSDGTAVVVSDDMAELLRRAVALRAATEDAFDVSIGALTQLWRDASAWPPAAQVAAARRESGPEALTLDGSRVARRPGVQIDLDGIAKGWAVDRCATELRRDGIAAALLSFGESSLYALGAPAGTRGWSVIVRGLDPDATVGALRLRDEAVSVSAVFGHSRYIGGRPVGHIVDPRSGEPLRFPGMALVVSTSATDAEAFSKALLIRGRAGFRGDMLRGALLVRPQGIQRFGRLAFTAAAQSIAATAEPLR